MTWENVVSEVSAQFADARTGAGLIRLVVCLLEAAALGAMVGWERRATGKAAGPRTHMLLCVGAAFMTAVPRLAGMEDEAVSRVLQGVLAGVGFLGGGAILKREDAGRITGLTTAAGLWLTTGVGIAVGLGMGVAAILCALLAFVILWLLGRLEHGPQPQEPGAPGQEATPTRRRRKKK